ncbi:Uncharacterized protein dnm_011470 [Desulfonema magnum]|uniref:Uncharacterized protein n=1 Tax=Desulfonema magnum TaxID=45655 RepID=A0A975BGS9_9BACT|nr:Uncharacterized protein dnm_011470 [Desulfonema magnum]
MLKKPPKADLHQTIIRGFPHMFLFNLVTLLWNVLKGI